MKMARVVEVALNGDAEIIEKPVRRALVSLADAIDESNEQAKEDLEIEVDKIIVTLDGAIAKVESVRRLLITTSSTVLVSLVLAVISILFGQ